MAMGGTSDGAKPRERRVVFLPPISGVEPDRTVAPDTGPDPAAFRNAFAAHGMSMEVIGPSAFPWNPFAGRHPLLRGLDPLRAFFILLRRRRVQAVVAVFEGPAVVMALLRRLMRFRPPLYMWDIGVTDRWPLRRRIQDLVIDRLDGIMVLSSGQADAVAATWRRHAPTHRVGYHVDTRFFRPVPAEQGGVVLAVGDDHGRDYATFLEAVADMATEVRIRTAQPLPLDLRRHATVRQIKARVPFPDLRHLYAEASVVVVPLHDLPHAGGVTAFVEAAAMGRPIVASAARGIADFLRHEETCLVVPCGEPGPMRVAIERLLGDPALRARLGAGARRYAERECSPEAIVARIAAVVGASSPARAR